MKYYCPYCGAKIKKNDRICNICDTKFNETHSNQEVLGEIERNPYGIYNEKSGRTPSKNHNIIVKLELVIIMVLLVVLIVKLLTVFGLQ